MTLTMSSRKPRNNSWREITSTIAYFLCAAAAFTDESTYGRYLSYPDYCSTSDAVQSRSIPDLQGDAVPVGVTRLIQVTAIIRHGARTPLGHETCWDGFDSSSETGSWNCTLYAYSATPPPQTVGEQEGEQTELELGLFLFQKRYDALESATGENGNVLNGSCQLGQLINRGRDQMVKNGALLKTAYLYDPENPKQNERLRLMPESYEARDVRLRSDDDQRTLMSGQILLTSMFGSPGGQPFVPLHLADKSRDIMSSNSVLCPRLKELEKEALQSDEYMVWNRSDEVRKVREFMYAEFGKVLPRPQSCLFLTMCNDLSLPDSVNDFGNLTPGIDTADLDAKYGPNRFQRLVDFDHKDVIFPYRYNDAALSKLSMGPLWAEILDILSSATSQGSAAEIAPRFVLFSAHDTTISQLMSSLGPRVWNETDWPPYASMMIIETHEVIGGNPDKSYFGSSFAFRLLYNGRVLTTTIDGCSLHFDLCDMNVLFSRIRPFAITSRNCETNNGDAENSASQDTWKTATSRLIDTPGGKILVAGTMLMSGMLGCVTAWWYLKRMSPFQFDLVRLDPIAGDAEIE